MMDDGWCGLWSLQARVHVSFNQARNSRAITGHPHSLISQSSWLTCPPPDPTLLFFISPSHTLFSRRPTETSPGPPLFAFLSRRPPALLCLVVSLAFRAVCVPDKRFDNRPPSIPIPPPFYYKLVVLITTFPPRLSIWQFSPTFPSFSSLLPSFLSFPLFFFFCASAHHNKGSQAGAKKLCQT